MEQTAFFVRCRVAFRRRVDSGGVSLSSDFLATGWTDWAAGDGTGSRHWQLPIREQTLLHGEWWL